MGMRVAGKKLKALCFLFPRNNTGAISYQIACKAMKRLYFVITMPYEYRCCQISYKIFILGKLKVFHLRNFIKLFKDRLRKRFKMLKSSKEISFPEYF